MESRLQKIKALVFDQYGTIVDIQKGLTDGSKKFLFDKGWSGDPHRFVTWWRRTHFENSMIDSLCENGHTPYREISRGAVSHVMDRCGISFVEEEANWLVDKIQTLKPFPEVPDSLASFREVGLDLAILSNGDPDMLDAARQYIGFDFDQIISVEEAGHYKPHWSTYALAEKVMQIRREECLFVANHSFDCIGAKSFGMQTAFINKRNRPFGSTLHSPDVIVPNMSELANIFCRLKG